MCDHVPARCHTGVVVLAACRELADMVHMQLLSSRGEACGEVVMLYLG